MKSNWKTLWLEAVAPDEPHKFERRLQWDAITEDDFYAALNKEHVFLHEDAPSAQESLQDSLEALKNAWDLPLLPVDNNFKHPFIDLWWPVRCHSAAKLREVFASDSAGLTDEIFDQLADSLLDRLCSLGDQVLWEAFNKERTPGTMLLAHLGATGDGSGPPVREHYERFIQSHRRNGLAALLKEFPVLGRLIGTVLSLWFQGSLEMLQRICADRTVLQQRFAIPCKHHLKTIKQGLSDPHRGGRAVAVLGFADPNSTDHSSMHVVYKPKDMAVDAAYQATLADLNTHSDLPPLRTLAIHNGDGYGYMEYVVHHVCANDQELTNFYFNAGRLTALLHLLGCTDCHHENLIACGDQLLLIDTETLLEADLPDHISDASSTTAQPEPSTLQKQFQRSVLRSGLLPQWMFLGESKQAFDISALGMSPPNKPDRIAPGWLGFNSDGMMPGRVSQPVEIPTSLPVGITGVNPFDRFLEDFCEGFSIQSEAIIKLRNRWLDVDGVLAHFAGLPRRIVLRATRVYFTIQRQQLEPAALRSSLAQALKLEQLARSFLLAESKPHHWQIFAAEVKQMQQLDIPFFTHLIDADALQLDGLEQELPGFIQTSGLAAAYERLRNLDADEIAFQLRLIRGAVEARQLRTSLESSPTIESPATSEALMSTSAETSLEAATRIAHRLLELAIRGSQGQVEWLGMDLGADGESFSFGPVGLSLYGGSIGIAQLLQRLQALQVSVMDAEAIQAAILEPLVALVDQRIDDGRRRWWRDQPLGLSGCGGTLLALALQGEQVITNSLLSAALPRFIEADQQLDVIGGCAGLIGPLVQLGTESAMQLALRAGDQLITQQNEEGAWSSSSSKPALLGFSHGVAGYAAALAHLHAFSGDERYRTAAAAALAYERARFNKDAGNWPDYRHIGRDSDSDEPSFMASWCHGAPGIALGRACLWGTALWDEECTKEIGIGLQTTAAVSAVSTDHLCCGSLGLMVLLEMLSAGPWPIDNQLRSHCQDVAFQYRLQALQRCSAEPVKLRCFGTKEGSLVLPGFFTGLSGMGLALLEDDPSRAVVSQLISAGLWPVLND
ncbi:type 2 lanthipeptide synthetase LanM family protein [Prochlorococcus sp. MIT 1201]|uniref:type 2 lanthipeptide synthetase LanM family protein n=1 Tax=Prochlorococcus sp. MIT 1201 TaxID=3082535 RepID=UPI0039A6D48A